MKLSCLIVEDESAAIKLLKSLIEKNTHWQIAASCQNARQALSFLEEHEVDFVLLDIHMPGLPGLQFVELLPAPIPVVFVTGDPSFALDSYSHRTIDYLLKPIRLQRFLVTVQKVETFLSPKTNEKIEKVRQGDAYFFVKSGKIFHRILIRNILYFEGEKEYVRLVTEQEKILLYRRLKDIEIQLPFPFVRVHNSYIVNVEQLSKIQENQVFIKDKEIPISEKYREHFLDVIRQKMF